MKILIPVVIGFAVLTSGVTTAVSQFHHASPLQPPYVYGYGASFFLLLLAGGIAIGNSEFVGEWTGRYDEKVFRVLTESLRAVKMQHLGRCVTMAPIPLEMIAEAVKRKPSSVYHSLRRLERHQKVQEINGGWILLGEKPTMQPHVHRL